MTPYPRRKKNTTSVARNATETSPPDHRQAGPWFVKQRPAIAEPPGAVCNLPCEIPSFRSFVAGIYGCLMIFRAALGCAWLRLAAIFY